MIVYPCMYNLLTVVLLLFWRNAFLALNDVFSAQILRVHGSVKYHALLTVLFDRITETYRLLHFVSKTSISSHILQFVAKVNSHVMQCNML